MPVKIAAVQMNVTLGDIAANLQAMQQRTQEAASAGARLVVFPECALTGYCFESREEAVPFAQSVPGDATEQLAGTSRDTGTAIVFGMLESDGDRLFNAAVLVTPDGSTNCYRKVHLPYLGVDRFTDFGDQPFAVNTAGDLQVGMHICYDAAFPEAARSMSIAGADLLVLPTNWPPGAENTATHTINSRAMENGVYFAAVNRVGTERGFTFIGRSSICDPAGNTIASAGPDEETILYAEIDPERARDKRVTRVPKKHVIDRLADRRPEMYGPLVEPHNLQRPGR